MAPPRRLTYSIVEAAARWSCSPADIIEWALAGLIELTTVVPAAMTDGGEVYGFMAIRPEEVGAMYRRVGFGPTEVVLTRLRPRNSTGPWLKILDPKDGIKIDAYAVLIASDTLEAFEHEHDLAPKPKNYAGGSAKWDWEGFYTALISRVFKHGLPEQQKDLVEEMQGWFERRSESGDAPDISTIRKKVAAVWRDLQAD